MHGGERATSPLVSIVRVLVALTVSFYAVAFASGPVESGTPIRFHPVVLPVGTVLLATGLLVVTSDAPWPLGRRR